MSDWYDANGNLITRADWGRFVDDYLVFMQRNANESEREAIIEYVIANDCAIMHGVTRVLGGCCHCADCRRGKGADPS